MEFLKSESTLTDDEWRPRGNWGEGNLESKKFKVPGDRFIIVRVDGKNFHKETAQMNKPYDEQFMKDMDTVTEKLVMDEDFRVIAGYTQSDEISLLIDRRDSAFDRKISKILSILAGKASAYLSIEMGRPVVMDARIFWATEYDNVFEYFWARVNDCYRNFINASMYWKLRETMEAPEANQTISGMNMEAMRNMLLNAFGVDLNERPGREQFGYMTVWKDYIKEGYNPKANKAVKALRRTVEGVDLISREHVINRLDMAMHIHHEIGTKRCVACTYNVPYCGYCKNSHKSDV